MLIGHPNSGIRFGKTHVAGGDTCDHSDVIEVRRKRRSKEMRTNQAEVLGLPPSLTTPGHDGPSIRTITSSASPASSVWPWKTSGLFAARSGLAPHTDGRRDIPSNASRCGSTSAIPVPAATHRDHSQGTRPALAGSRSAASLAADAQLTVATTAPSPCPRCDIGTGTTAQQRGFQRTRAGADARSRQPAEPARSWRHRHRRTSTFSSGWVSP